MNYQTDNRERLIAFFRGAGEAAFSLEEICAALAPDGHGKSTLYRLVSSMTEEGILRKISDPASRHCTYQYVGGERCAEHLHLKCTGCGKLIHLDESISHALEDEILSSENFAIDEGMLLFGKCGTCRKKAQ